MFCYKCGTKLEDTAAFCYACGASQTTTAMATNTDRGSRTYSVFTGSVPNVTPAPQWNGLQTTTPRKDHKGLLIGLAAGGGALLLAIILIAVFSAGNNTEKPTGNIPATSTTASSQNYEKEIAESIDKSKAYVTENNFAEALAVLDTAEQLYGKDPRIDEQRNRVNVAKVLNDVSVYEKEKNYVKAIECIENSTETTKNNADVVQKLHSLKIAYKNHILTLAEDTFHASGYNAAIDVLNESLKYLSNDEEINAAIRRYEEYIPVSVAKLEYFTGNAFALNNNVKDNLGNTRDNVVSPKPVGWSNAATTNVYKLNKQYSRLSGIWFQLYDFRTEVKYGIGATDYLSKLEIYGDGKLLYSGEIKAGVEPKNIDLNISGVTELKIYYFGGGSDGSYSGIADFNVQK